MQFVYDQFPTVQVGNDRLRMAWVDGCGSVLFLPTSVLAYRLPYPFIF